MIRAKHSHQRGGGTWEGLTVLPDDKKNLDVTFYFDTNNIDKYSLGETIAHEIALHGSHYAKTAETVKKGGKGVNPKEEDHHALSKKNSKNKAYKNYENTMKQLIKNMRKMHKLINKIFPTFSILILLLSCKENKTKYFLKSKDDKNTIYKVELLKKEIIITELSKKENIKKVNVYYKVGRDYVLRTSGRKPIVYFSLNSNQDFIKDDFSLLNDSIITGNSENNIFFTKRKSNNKPIEYSYYYDKDFFITKIIYHIGTKEIIYNKATH